MAQGLLLVCEHGMMFIFRPSFVGDFVVLINPDSILLLLLLLADLSTYSVAFLVVAESVFVALSVLLTSVQTARTPLL